jgi:hypothetical protein
MLISYDELINGCTSRFFNPTRGLRKGHPLYPLLFLIIVEGSSKATLKAKIIREIYVIKIRRDINLSHLIFVENVMSLIKGSPRKERNIYIYIYIYIGFVEVSHRYGNQHLNILYPF